VAKTRLAFARIAQETNALSPVLTEMHDFESVHLLAGDTLLQACMPKGYEAQGFVKNAELSGCVKAGLNDGNVEFIPLTSAWAVPSGPLSKATFDELLGRVIDGLKAAGPVDAVYLSLHGAMNTLGIPDPDAYICEVIKQEIGGAPLGITLDLHGNLNPRIVAASDVLYGYKTNPHRDHAARGRQCTKQLLRVARGEIHPAKAWRSLPMILGGGLMLDFLKPMRPLFRWMKAQERKKGVLGCSLFTCHLWNNTPELGWSTYAMTDGDQAGADALAEELAEKCWAVRHELPPELPDEFEAIEQVRSARVARITGTVCMSDASDVVAAGATGENTKLLRAFMDKGQDLVAYFPIRDPQAVDELWDTELGEQASLSVGGRLDPKRNDPIQVSGRVHWKGDRHGFGKTVALDMGNIKLVITSGPALCMKPDFYSDVDLSPWKADVCVVKSFFPFRLFFALQNRKSIYVKTGGITDFDAAKQLQFSRPVHPFHELDDWKEADRARRS
jgi:microcystin degradation protein MlrC